MEEDDPSPASASTEPQKDSEAAVKPSPPNEVDNSKAAQCPPVTSPSTSTTSSSSSSSALKRSFDVAFLVSSSEKPPLKEEEQQRSFSAFSKYTGAGLVNNNDPKGASGPRSGAMPAAASGEIEDNHRKSVTGQMHPHSGLHPQSLLHSRPTHSTHLSGQVHLPHHQSAPQMFMGGFFPFMPKIGPTVEPGLPPAAGPGSPFAAVAALGMAAAVSASNTCAKCGLSFRMTSDLVYHMRTHHSRTGSSSTSSASASGRRPSSSSTLSSSSSAASDPSSDDADPRRLRCHVCGENFRERHHLTRHMIAHQDRTEDERRRPEGNGSGNSAAHHRQQQHTVNTTLFGAF